MAHHGPRGRHRAPTRFTFHLPAAARITAIAAVSGGLVAAVAAPQAAHADGVASMTPAAHRAALTTVSDVNATAIPAPYESGPQVVDLAVRSAAAPQTHRRARTHAAKAPVRHTDRQQVSRSATRPAPAHAPKQKTEPPKPSPAPTTPPPSGVSRSGAVGIAMKYLGVPYVWGGESPSGFDCSGLVQYVFRQLGISLPRTASAQQAAVARVGTPQPGDLVFFGYPAYHVGIYAGNGQMIDAPKPGETVRLTKIWGTPSGYGRPGAGS